MFAPNMPSSLSQQQEWSRRGLSLFFLILTTVLLVKDLDQARRFAYVLLLRLFALAGVFALIGIYITEHLWVRPPQWIPLS
jgi:hypothetical protein